LVFSEPVFAQGDKPIETKRESVEIFAEDNIVKPGSRPDKDPGDSKCNNWELATEDDFIDSMGVNGREFSETGRWWRATCGNIAFGLGRGGPMIMLFPEGNRVNPRTLILTAADELKPGEPPVVMNPPSDSVVVQLPSLFSIPSVYWVANSKTVTAGRVTVTATITPVTSIWNPGDGSRPVRCTGPGQEYFEGMDWKNAPCSYTYTKAVAPGDFYEMETTAVFTISGTTNIPGYTLGAFDPLQVSSTTPVEAGEIQALITRNRN